MRDRRAANRTHVDAAIPGLSPPASCCCRCWSISHFVILPTLNSLYYSFTDWVGYGTDYEFIGLANFERIFSDRLFSNAIRNTAVWLALAMTVPTLLGLALALGLQGKRTINTVYKSLFYLPICLSPVIIGIIWVWLYSPKLGIVNHVPARAGLGCARHRLAGEPEHGAGGCFCRLGLAADRV